jgi:hypothetical protein
MAPSLPPGIDWDNQVKLQVAWNLLHGDGPALTRPTPWDDAYVVQGADGARYAGYPLLASIIHFPTIGIMALAGATTAALPALFLLGAAAWLLVLWGRRSGVSPPAAVAGAMLACVATALWPITAHANDNVIEVLGLVAVLWAASGDERPRAWVWAGLAVGCAVAIRYGAAVLAVPAAVAIAWQAPRGLSPAVRRGLAFALGCAPGAALVAGYNVYRFGSPFTVHTRTALGSVGDLVVPWFSTFHWEGMAGLLVSPGKGALWYGPPLLGVVLLGVALARRHGATFAAIGAYALAGVILFGRLRFWHGDLGWGPRYVAPLYVAVAALGWWGWDYLASRGRAVRAAAVATFVVLAAAQAVAATTYPHQVAYRRVVQPLARAGQVVTRPLHAPPVPEDNGVLYFRLSSSPLLVAWDLAGDVIAGDVPELGPEVLEVVRANLAWAALLPALSIAAVAAVAALDRRERGAAPAPEVA